MWKSFENIGLQTSDKVSWEKKETCAKHKIDRSQNGRSNKQAVNSVDGVADSASLVILCLTFLSRVVATIRVLD